MAAKIRVAIIGVGRMGITHYSILNAHPDVTVTAVAEPTPLINSFLDKYLEVRTYKDYTRLLEKETVDALVVCTPPALNSEVLRAAHAAGAHVFVEKPGTLVASQALELAALFESRGLVNQVGYVNRFNDVFGAARQLLVQRALGEVIRFRSEMYSRTIIREEEGGSWRSARDSGGGAVYEMASHCLDLVNFLFGPPDEVTGTALSQVFSRSVEDIVSSTLRYQSGLVGSLYVNWSDASYRKPTNRIEVFGKAGKLTADQYGLKVYLNEASPQHNLRAGWNSRYITDLFSSVPFFVRGIEFTAQLNHFVECIAAPGTVRNRCTLRDAADTLAVIEDLFRDQARETREAG